MGDIIRLQNTVAFTSPTAKHETYYYTTAKTTRIAILVVHQQQGGDRSPTQNKERSGIYMCVCVCI